MDQKYTVQYESRPPFNRGDVVTRADVEKAGYDFEAWLGHHGLKPLSPTTDAPPAP